MVLSLRVLPCLFVAAQLLGPNSAQSQGYPLPYARLLTSEEVREVLNCPWCNDALLVVAGPTLLGRTAEGVNLTFANLVIARGAVELLNSMARARNRCARAEYKLALGQYRDLIGLRDEKTAQGGNDEASVFALLNPHHDLSPLAEYVVPLFQDCGLHHKPRRQSGTVEKQAEQTVTSAFMGQFANVELWTQVGY